MTKADSESFGRHLANEHSPEFEFLNIRTHQYVDKRFQQLQFQHYTGKIFIYVPRYESILGFDCANWKPSNAELSSYQKTADRLGLTESITEFVKRNTTPPRLVSVLPMLAEIDATDDCFWENLTIDDEQIQSLIAKYGNTFTLEKEGWLFKVSDGQGQDGNQTAKQAPPKTHENILTDFKRFRFTLPTANEWEYLCGGDSNSLFRWGNHAPTYGDPYAAHKGKFRFPEMDSSPFGLRIASNPYHNEVLLEPGITRGGDQGLRISTSQGFFLTWLTLATAYNEEAICRYKQDEPIHPNYTVARRIYHLTEDHSI